MVSNIRGERARLGFTQEELAQQIHVSESLVRDWEAGRVLPSTGALIEMSELFNCTIDYLLGKTEERIGFSAVVKAPTLAN